MESCLLLLLLVEKKSYRPIGFLFRLNYRREIYSRGKGMCSNLVGFCIVAFYIENMAQTENRNETFGIGRIFNLCGLLSGCPRTICCTMLNLSGAVF